MTADYYDEDDPLWKRFLLNEILWAFVAAIIILGLAFHFATGSSSDEEKDKTEQR